LKIPKRQSEARNQRRTDHIMVKRKKTKEQTMIYKTLHRKLKIQQHEAIKTGVNSGAPEGLSVPAPNVVNNGKLMYIYLCS
jgi:hypothetical protein